MKKKKNNITETANESIMEKNSMKLFTMLSGYFLLVLLLFSLLQFINCINLNIIQIVSVVTPIIVYLIKNKLLPNKKKIITILIYGFLILVLPFIYTKTYDLSVDGNAYHKTAIAFLKNGWNPLYESARKFQKNNDKVIPIAKEHNQDLWMEHYPKATWIVAATMYEMTGNIESGKCITLVLSIMLLIISYNCLKKIIDKKWALIISIAITLNPIVLGQLFTYYVDGVMGICYIIELLLLINIKPTTKIEKSTIINLIAICCIFVNLKFTGLLCSGVIAAIYYFYWLIINRKNNFKEVFKRLTLMFVAVFALSIFIVGSNSYVQNTVEHHNPLYPLIGKDKYDIVTTMEPKNFNNQSKIKKFIVSTLSKTENVSGGGYTNTKIPFIIYKEEITNLYSPDVRIAGFGPYNALIAIISIILFTWLGILLYKKEKENFKYLLLPLLTIIVTVILVGESWWARYVPQLYIIPISILLLTIYLRKYYKKKLFIVPSIVLSAVLLVNISCFLYIDAKEAIGFISIYKDIRQMKKVDNLKLKLGGYTDLYGYYYTLSDNGVKYTISNDVPKEKMIYKYSWRIGVEACEELY